MKKWRKKSTTAPSPPHKQINLSIIIPVYNNDKYIQRCLDSVLAQSYNDFELIIVDDGSTDGSSEICKKYASTDSRIIYTKIPNSGAGAARNIGIKLSKGKYITFIDSDDWIDTELYSNSIPFHGKRKHWYLHFFFLCEFWKHRKSSHTF